MIITRTPLRISLVGGGTDMPEFYIKHGGAVVSMAINKYIYISVNPHFHGNIRVSYSLTENVQDASEVQHDLVRSCLQMFDRSGLEITSVADIPGEGSGLGSSSAFVVGLLHALKPNLPRKILAETGFLIESGAEHTVGKQDHYAAAYGGFHFFTFNHDHVGVEPICLSPEKEKYILGRMLLFWTGITRKAEPILSAQAKNLGGDPDITKTGIELRDLAHRLHDDLCKGNLNLIGKYLRQNWHLKKRMAKGITTPEIDDVYKRAIKAGASGAKLLGAGGGGFLLVYADPRKHVAIRKAVLLQEIPFGLDSCGSTIVYSGGGT